MKKQEVTKEMSISECISRHPETIKILMKHGMSCIGCPMAMSETIEQAATAHGIDAGKIIAELNKAARKKK